jgi:hypothetical protein
LQFDFFQKNRSHSYLYIILIKEKVNYIQQTCHLSWISLTLKSVWILTPLKCARSHWILVAYVIILSVSWASSPCKLVFNGELYSRFVSFGIKTKHHVIGLSLWYRVGHRKCRLWSAVACYDHRCLTWLKYNLNHAYISFWAFLFYKPVFKGAQLWY